MRRDKEENMKKFTLTLVKNEKGELLNKRVLVPQPEITFQGKAIKWLPDKYKEENRI